MEVEDLLLKVRTIQDQINHATRVDENDEEEFWDNVAWVWFNEIGPDRMHQYGTEGITRFGKVGVFYQIANCYFRWKNLLANGGRAAALRDTIVDSFGYAVLMAAADSMVYPTVLEISPMEGRWIFQQEDCSNLFESLALIFHDDFARPEFPEFHIALKLSFNMYIVTKKEYKTP